MISFLNGFGGVRTHDQEIKSFLRFQLRYEPNILNSTQSLTVL